MDIPNLVLTLLEVTDSEMTTMVMLVASPELTAVSERTVTVNPRFEAYFYKEVANRQARVSHHE